MASAAGASVPCSPMACGAGLDDKTAMPASIFHRCSSRGRRVRNGRRRRDRHPERPTDTCDMVRNGARLVLRYGTSNRWFTRTVTNTTEDECAGVCANSEERGLPEGEDAAIASQEFLRHRQHAEKEGADEDVGLVGIWAIEAAGALAGVTYTRNE